MTSAPPPIAEYRLTAIEESIIPGIGTWRFPRYIGLWRAKRMSILGDFIDGEEAKRSGLADHLVGEGDYEAEFAEIVADYMQINSRGARAPKQVMGESFARDWEDFWESYVELQHDAMDHPDYAEAKEAALEDREPEWH